MAPLTNFIDVGPRTSVYTPSNPEQGQLIIICTWLGAGRKHIARYTTMYQKIAPRARLLLVQSAVPILVSSYAHQRRAIQPAVSITIDRLTECGQKTATAADGGRSETSSTSSVVMPAQKRPKILLHTFSNGGTNTATQLLIVLRESIGAPLPLAGLLCDSCPAKGTYWKSYDAMLLSLPKDIMSRTMGMLACHTILILLYSWIAYGNENPASLQRRTLLDANNFEPGWGIVDNVTSDAQGRVCYLYSKVDRMCQWTDIQEHAEIARDKGWQVLEVVFDGSGHCAHLAKDEQAYSNAVRSLWEGDETIWNRKLVSKL